MRCTNLIEYELRVKEIKIKSLWILKFLTYGTLDPP